LVQVSSRHGAPAGREGSVMPQAILSPDKLALIERVHLENGVHANFEAGVCAQIETTDA
jgi:hypothetical protein